MNKIIYYIVNSIILIFMIIIYPSIILSQNTQENVPIIPYKKSIFIGYEYIFLNNEGLNHPMIIRYNSTNNEFVVMDDGNNCLYLFNNTGKFIRKIGRTGQGPGEFIGPKHLITGVDGIIYVFDIGTERVSIFSKDGDFIKSLRIEFGTISPTIYDTDKIIINISATTGFYFSVYSNKGELLKNVAKLDKYSTDMYNIWYNRGRPIIDENNNYYMFLSYLGIVKIFDEKGNEKKQHKFNETYAFQKSRKIEKEIKGGVLAHFQEVQYINNKFYIFAQFFIDDKEIKTGSPIDYALYVYRKDMVLERILYMPTGFILKDIPTLPYLGTFALVGINEDIYIPQLSKGEILKFSKNK